jgi:hypothetical protein
MRRRTRGVVLLLAGGLLVIAVLLWAFPKERVVGGLRGGPIGPGESAYREDYLCLGIKSDVCPNWPDYGCDRLCYGAVVRQTCTIETYDPERGVLTVPVECRGPARPRWLLPAR